MNHDIISLDEFDDILQPRTPAEHAGTLALWLDKGGLFSANELDELKASDSWRTKKEVYRGREFCVECQQLIPDKYCRACGLPLGQLATVLDLVPVPSDLRKELVKTAECLIKTPAKPKLVLAFLHFVNQSAKNPLWQDDVETIFTEACAQEIIRRRKAA